MSDIKHIKFDVPLTVPKARKSRKTQLKTTQVKPAPKVVSNPIAQAPVVKTITPVTKGKPVINVNLPYANSPHTPSPIKKPVLTPNPVKVIKKPVKPEEKYEVDEDD